MRCGYGTLYYKNKNILYKGQWDNNCTHGLGEEFDVNGKLVYKGEWFYNEKKML